VRIFTAGVAGMNFFQSELISEILKIFAARSTKCNTLHRRNPRSISVFQT